MTGADNPKLVAVKRASKVERRFPVKVRASAATFGHDHIVSLPFAGEVRGGDRIDQDALSVELGVSRIPIREGLVQLEREGIVTIDYNRGAYLAAFDESMIHEHFELGGSSPPAETRSGEPRDRAYDRRFSLERVQLRL